MYHMTHSSLKNKEKNGHLYNLDFIGEKNVLQYVTNATLGHFIFYFFCLPL